MENRSNRVQQDRVRKLNQVPLRQGPVIYWMSRDQRVDDNWALLYAQELALTLKEPLLVLFCLTPDYLGATAPQYRFMLEGLNELTGRLKKLQITFISLQGNPDQEVARFCRELKAGGLVCDFNPLRINRQWQENLASNLGLACHLIDAHNIVPCWVASPKQEYAAYTIRPKLKKLLPSYLTDFPALIRHPYQLQRKFKMSAPKEQQKWLTHSGQARQTYIYKSGETAARQFMQQFIENRLASYETERNNPVLNGQSNLSPYLHFGQLSAQKLAWLIKQAEEPGINSESFLEELIVRRELSDNFCYYNNRYDSIEAFPRWARETLADHAEDPREHIYNYREFETAATHDSLWNAAQQEMVLTGKMHGYLRMYWAKKILEWSDSAELALEWAIKLNNHYSLDGRDPNGYAGIAWSIGGVHDRAWFQRPIFGKIRYMSYKGSKSKFNVDGYIAKMNKLADQ